MGRTPSPGPSRLHSSAGLRERWARGRAAARRRPAPAPPRPLTLVAHRPARRAPLGAARSSSPLASAGPRTPADPAPFPEITTRPTAGPRGGWCPRLLTVGRRGSARSCGARRAAPWRGSRSCGLPHQAIVAPRLVSDEVVTQVRVLLVRECGTVLVRESFGPSAYNSKMKTQQELHAFGFPTFTQRGTPEQGALTRLQVHKANDTVSWVVLRLERLVLLTFLTHSYAYERLNLLPPPPPPCMLPRRCVFWYSICSVNKEQ